MKLIWTEQASADMVELFAYIQKDSPKNAGLVVGRIFAAIERLYSDPLIGRPGRLKNTRELFISKTSCVVVYCVSKEAISLIRIQRGARRR